MPYPTSKNPQLTRKNHFVPEGLLKKWKWDDNELRGYWWDYKKQKLQCKVKGARGFCFERDLLTTNTRDGDTDHLERQFEEIDTAGIVARDKMLEDGPASLNSHQRSDFARLLMSLVVRRPSNVRKLTTAADNIKHTIDNDPELITAFNKAKIDLSPSDFLDENTRQGFAIDRSFERMVRSLSDWAEVGQPLIEADWRVVGIPEAQVSYV